MEDGSDPYQVLGVAQSATSEEIRKAYREVARTHHPDKTAGLPTEAASRAIFEKAKAAMQLLSDAEARAAYDRVLELKAAAQRRNAQRDAAQRDARSRLEEREDAARRALRAEQEAQRRLQAQIARLRAENEAQLQAERERVAAAAVAQEEAAEEAQRRAQGRKEREQRSSYELKVRWTPPAGDGDSARGTEAEDYTLAELQRLFGKYGAAEIVVSSRKGRALVSYRHRHEAQLARECERGRADLPLTRVSWAHSRDAGGGEDAEMDEDVDGEADGGEGDGDGDGETRGLQATTLSDAAFEAYEAAVLSKLRSRQKEHDEQRQQQGDAARPQTVGGR